MEGPIVGQKKEGKEVPKTESLLFTERTVTGFTPADGSHMSSGFVVGNSRELTQWMSQQAHGEPVLRLTAQVRAEAQHSRPE